MDLRLGRDGVPGPRRNDLSVTDAGQALSARGSESPVAPQQVDDPVVRQRVHGVVIPVRQGHPQLAGADLAAGSAHARRSG